MSNTKDNQSKQADSNNGVSPTGNVSSLSALLTAALNDPANGLRLRGVVVSASAESTFSGETNGRKWEMTTKNYDVGVGDSVYQCGFNKEDGIPDLPYGSIIEVEVSRTRMVGNKISVSGKLIG